jgi:hypothetical protein
MDRWLIAVQTNCTDPTREGEFNDWYDNTHIPDVLKVPGIVRMTRYENVTPGEQPAKYLTLLEVEAEDIWEVTTALTHNRDRAEKSGRMTPLLELANGTIYRRIGAPRESR